MTVLLQLYDRRGQMIKEALKVRPREDIFEKTLLGMKVPQEVIDKMIIVVEFIDMIPDGGTIVFGDNKFGVYLRTMRIQHTFNETIAHELKHIATEVLKPKKDRKDGKRKGPYKWEEVNCNRAEKIWGKLDYFEFLTTGEDK